MKRRSKVSRKLTKARRAQASEPKRGLMPSKASRPASPNSGKQGEIARLTCELDEAHARQAATSEVLHAISSSPDDLHSVFQAMLESAVRICDAKVGNIYRREGETFVLLASQNLTYANRSHSVAETCRPVLSWLSTLSKRTLASK
jgi:hypothetical protein